MNDDNPLDYVDAHGTQWIMAACGHRCGGGVTLGDKIALCPNCQLILRIKGSVLVVYEDRLPRLPENVAMEKQREDAHE